MDKLLTQAVSKIVMVIRLFNQSDDLTELKEIKKLILGLARCLASFGFDKGVESVEAILPELCRNHTDGQLTQFGSLFATTLSDDSLVPIKVANAEEEETFNSFNYAAVLLKRQKNYPKSLPFSKSIPIHRSVIILQMIFLFVSSSPEQNRIGRL